MHVAAKVSRWTAALWAAAFAAVHLAWALGLRTGLPADVSIVEDRRLLVVDLIAIPLCAMASVAALMAKRDRRARWLCATIAAFALVHGAPPLAGALIDGLSGQPVLIDERTRYALLLYEPYWLLGGMLFAAVFATACPSA